MKFLNITLIKLSLIFLIGVICGFVLKLSISTVSFLFIFSFSLFLPSYFRARKLLFPDRIFGITSYLIIFVSAILVTSIHMPENQTSHYIQLSKVERNSVDLELMKVKVLEQLKPDLYNNKYVVEAEAIFTFNNSEGKKSTTKSQGKLLLNIKQDSLAEVLIPGSKLIVPFTPNPIKASLNPFQFSYKDYLSRQKIMSQIFLNRDQISVLKDENFGVLEIAGKIRIGVLQKLKTYSFQSEELAVMQALLLGQRQELSKETNQNYASAGAMHILALSGLHIGIILIILNWFLKPLDRFRKAKLIKIIILLLALWSFALISGFSPSVVRAVSMFSFLAIGMQLNRRTSAMNSVFASLLILLIFNPYYIFQAGFQLSYLAVIAIILLYPKINALYTPRFKLDKILWNIVSVSCAAQIGVLPLSLYYFHQFPGLFIFSNLIILPFLGMLLGLGFLVIFLAMINVLPEFVVDFYARLISTLNKFVRFIAEQEAFIIDNIQLNFISALSLYAIICCGIYLLYAKNYRSILLSLTAIILFQISQLTAKVTIPESEIIVFHKNRETLIGVKQREKFTLFSKNDKEVTSQNPIKDYLRNNHLEEAAFVTPQNFIITSNKNLLIVDSAGVFNIPEYHTDFVLLQYSPKMNLERLIELKNPEVIIADGSNYTSYIQRWEATCIKQKVPFYFTGKKGAFRYSTGPK